MLLSKKASPYSQQVDLLICIQGKARAHFHTDAPFTAEEAPLHPPDTAQHSIPANQHRTIATISSGKYFPTHLNLSFDPFSCS